MTGAPFSFRVIRGQREQDGSEIKAVELERLIEVGCDQRHVLAAVHARHIRVASVRWPRTDT